MVFFRIRAVRVLRSLLLRDFRSALFVLLLSSAVVCAQQTSAPTGVPGFYPQWLRSSQLSGDWGGVRTHLKEHGVLVNARYITESGTVYAGGSGAGTASADDLALGFDADLKTLAHWDGAHFHFGFSRRHGGSISKDDLANNILAVQEDYGAGETNHITELSVDQNLLHDHWNVKAGAFIMGNDFARNSTLCDFQNLGFCAHTESLPVNAAWADWPTAELGVRVRYFPHPGWIFGIAAFEANAANKKARNGLNLTLEEATGVVIPVEIFRTVNVGKKALPGHYKLGGYYDSSEAAVLANPDTKRAGRYGGYLLADQVVWNFEPGTKRGLELFAQYTLSDRVTAPMSDYELLAADAKGPFRRRPDDYINVGCVRAGLNAAAKNYHQAKLVNTAGGDFLLSGAESACEVGYGVQVAPAILIHPNFQFIGNPGTFVYERVSNGWVFGLTTKIVF